MKNLIEDNLNKEQLTEAASIKSVLRLISEGTVQNNFTEKEKQKDFQNKVQDNVPLDGINDKLSIIGSKEVLDSFNKLSYTNMIKLSVLRILAK